MHEPPAAWDAERVRGLRRALALSQHAFARELGVRQQTVSDWETGLYRPRGASARVLSLVAERAGFAYGKTEAKAPMQEGPGHGDG
jgi:DNA-binding transcriptional regulator YiaG